MTATYKRYLSKTMSLPNFEDTVPLMITFAPNWPVRTVVFRVFGTALILSSAAMWVMPGASLSIELAAMKFGSSLFFFLCGLALLMMHHADNQPDAYFDPIRRELRVLQKNNRGRPHTILRRSYETLGSARFLERQVELYDVDGSLLLRLPIQSAEIRQALRMQLSGLVNITS
ncbi:hypothetical protein ACFORG_13800 [Lutimaribacter marinistellae]|uniref:Uncharacterized protein n=1 Tax=Lutimaribacter marinistellae TaxID=1820329 RepID=A0ABV7TJB7_9RHOB